MNKFLVVAFALVVGSPGCGQAPEAGLRDAGHSETAMAAPAAAPIPKGANASLAQSHTAVAEHPSTIEVANRIHGLRALFRQEGVRFAPVEGAWSARLSTTHFGRPGHLEPVPKAMPTVAPCTSDQGCAERILYRRSGLMDEWYRSTVHGIEQRFELWERPPGTGPVRLVMAWATTLEPTLVDDGATVALRDLGAIVATLSGLRVWDSDGVPLNARLLLEERSLIYEFEDDGARWPLTVDPPVGDCPASWCSDGDPATVDVCNAAGSECTHLFDDSFEGEACVWGSHCCPDGRYHLDCADPSWNLGQDCPDGWCSDGDPGTVDSCTGYQLATGTFACEHTFDSSLAGTPCVWGAYCCADGRLHADCEDASVPSGQDCPAGWCNDGDPTTMDACSGYVPATGDRTCTHTLDPSSAGTPCTYGKYCCASQTIGAPCPSGPGDAAAPEPEPEPEPDAEPEPSEETGQPAIELPSEPAASCVLTMGDGQPCPDAADLCGLTFTGGQGCVSSAVSCTASGAAYEVPPGSPLVIDAPPPRDIFVQLDYVAAPGSVNELRFLGANDELIAQTVPAPCPEPGFAQMSEPRRFAFSKPVVRIVVASAVSSVFLDQVSFGTQALGSGVCGDGQLDSGEACDDGNATSGDGCTGSGASSGGCVVEEGFVCVAGGACQEAIPVSASPAPQCGDNSCDANATCSIWDGQIVCSCNSGFGGDGSTCTACLPACQTCGSGGQCTSCGGELVLSGGECLSPDGATCSSNADCVNACIASQCSPAASTGGACDETDDCAAEHTCVGSECRLDNGGTCANDSDCVGTCVSTTGTGVCSSLGGAGDPCDDSLDCESNHSCTSNVCLGQTGAACTVASTTSTECTGGLCVDDGGGNLVCSAAPAGACPAGEVSADNGAGTTCIPVDECAVQAASDDYVLNPDNGHFYYFPTDSGDWSANRSFCNARGGELVTIDDAAENAFFFANAAITSSGATRRWLGLNDLDRFASTGDSCALPSCTLETLVWQNGASSTYRQGGGNDPSGNGQCVSMDHQSNWDDHGCNGPRRFACEFPYVATCSSGQTCTDTLGSPGFTCN